LGFVDVPGHERFVHNMLAGIGGIDLVLLVIAADESIMPQTREHFDICRLLSVRRGITVLAKSDLVDSETLRVVRLEVEDFVRGSFLDSSHSPIIPVSSLTGDGVELLKQELGKMAAELAPKDVRAFPRLPIDRVFTKKGFGTIVTGTLVSGTIRQEDELETFPGSKRLRVRRIEVHGKQREQAVAGERTALNLASVSKEELARGLMLAPPSMLQSTSRLHVSLRLLSSSRPLHHRQRVRFHAYTAETTATVLLAGARQLGSGAEGSAELRLASPVLVLPGDRFILRQFSPVVTIGGGIVLDAAPIPQNPKAALESFLEVLARGEPREILEGRIARRRERGASLLQLVAETGWRPESIVDRLEAEPNRGRPLRTEDLFVDSAVVEGLKELLAAAAARFHEREPLVAGISQEALRRDLGLRFPIFAMLLKILVAEGKLEAGGDRVRVAGRVVVMKEQEAESLGIIEKAFLTAGLKVPDLKDVLSGLKVDQVRARKIVTLLLKEKTLIKVTEDLVFHRASLEELRRRLAAEKTKSARLDVARFKHMAGVSRKYAIPLLEYLDRERVTRREKDERVIL
jgi:selenocysteine-specific elongation factor